MWERIHETIPRSQGPQIPDIVSLSRVKIHSLSLMQLYKLVSKGIFSSGLFVLFTSMARSGISSKRHLPASNLFRRESLDWTRTAVSYHSAGGSYPNRTDTSRSSRRDHSTPLQRLCRESRLRFSFYVEED